MNKKLLISISLCLLVPVIVYAGFWDNIRSFFGSLPQQEQVISLGGTFCYEYQGCTGTSTYAVGDILYARGTSDLASLVVGSAYQLLMTNSAACYFFFGHRLNVIKCKPDSSIRTPVLSFAGSNGCTTS